MKLAAATICENWKLDHAVRKPTLGIPEGPFLERVSTEARTAFENQIDELRSAGYDVRRQELFEDIEMIDERHRNVIRKETALVHEKWFDEYEPFYRTTTAEAIREGRKVTDEELATGRTGMAEVRELVHGKMDTTGIDIWLTPATRGPAPKGLASTGSSAMNRPWTYAGLPALTVPVGTIDGLPIGLQCITRNGADEQLLAWANALDRTLT
jgi:Asp-tRNA(Asn)/Glu-tRNA(Gln) amidotransferase A subunit family amidase